jgi:hypothetical protein
MPDKEAIEDQLQLLAAYRRTLIQYLKQQATIGTTYIQPGVTQGIHEARHHIKRIKNTLKGWGVDVEDWPDDEELPEEAPPRPIGGVALRSTASIWRYWPVTIAIAALIFMFLGTPNMPQSLIFAQVTPSPFATDSPLAQGKGFTGAPSIETSISPPQPSPQAIAMQIVVSSPEKLLAQPVPTDPPAAPPTTHPTLTNATPPNTPNEPPQQQPTTPPTLPIATAPATPTNPPAAAAPTTAPKLQIATAPPTSAPTSTPNSVPTLAGINVPSDAAQSGLRVVAVEPLSPAAQAGFRVGQILLSLNGQATQDVETARSIIAQNKGKSLSAIVMENSILLTIVVTPGDGDLGIDLCSVALCV